MNIYKFIRRHALMIAKLFLIFVSISSTTIAIADTSNPSFLVGNKTIVLKAPSGFYEVTQISDYDQKLMESFTPDSQKLLGAFYTESDIGRVLKKEDPELTTYILAKVLKTRINTNMSRGEFKKFKKFAKENIGRVSDLVPEHISDFFATASADVSKLSGVLQEIKLDQPVQLGEFNETSNSLSFAMLNRYSHSDVESDGSYVAAITNTYFLVEGKLITFDVYKLYDQPRDLTDLKKLTIDWIDSAN